MATTKKLHIALEDLKDCFNRIKRPIKGVKCLDAYVTSVERSRKVTITVNAQVNGTLEFAIDAREDSAEDGTFGAKYDIQRQVCLDEAIKKYDQPSKYMPSKEDNMEMEMSAEDQERLQKSGPQALTMEALEEHDMKTATGPRELRQFTCDKCHVSWWRTVIKTNPVSRCKGKICGQRYDALPRYLEFGIGHCICPNDTCDFEFFVRCEAKNTFKCCKCKTECSPYVHPNMEEEEEEQKEKEISAKSRS